MAKIQAAVDGVLIVGGIVGGIINTLKKGNPILSALAALATVGGAADLYFARKKEAWKSDNLAVMKQGEKFVLNYRQTSPDMTIQMWGTMPDLQRLEDSGVIAGLNLGEVRKHFNIQGQVKELPPREEPVDQEVKYEEQIIHFGQAKAGKHLTVESFEASIFDIEWSRGCVLRCSGNALILFAEKGTYIDRGLTSELVETFKSHFFPSN